MMCCTAGITASVALDVSIIEIGEFNRFGSSQTQNPHELRYATCPRLTIYCTAATPVAKI